MGIRITGMPSTRSALTISNLGQHLAHTLSGSEWRELAPLFDGTFADTVSIPPRRSARIGALLHKAAKHRLMPGEWAGLATEMGTAAHQTARAGKNWEWS